MRYLASKISTSWRYCWRHRALISGCK